MRFIKIVLCVVVCVALLMTAASCKEETPSPEDEIINYSITYEPDSLDPQIADDSASRLIVLNIFEGLTRLDENEEPTAGVASLWNISDNDTVYTFYLREDAHWQNGEPVTADDFLYGFQRAIMPETGSSSASDLFCIKNAEKINSGEADLSSLGVSVIDETTLKIELEYPEADFLSILASAPAMPCNKKFFTSTGGQYGREPDKLLSNGAFYVRDSGWSHNEYIYLRKNSEYKGKDKPVPAGINITITDTPENICTAILDGTTDCCALPGSELQQAEDNKLNLTSFGDTVWGISFNTKNEVLQHKEIRHALLAALDRKYILKTVPDGCAKTSDIIPDGASINGEDYRTLAGSGLSIDYSDKAKDELQKAMKKLSIDELPKLTILCSDDEPTQKIVNNIIETWNKLTGSYINKRSLSVSELKDAVRSGEYRVIIAPLTADGESPLNTLQFFSSGSSYNTAQLSDSSYDSLLEEIKTSPDSKALTPTVNAEQYLNDNGIFYPLYVESRYYASAPNVTGVIFHPYGAEVDFFYATKIAEE